MLNRRDFLKSAVAAGAAIGVPSAARAAAGAVRGTVSCGAAPLGGVLVSDGCRVVRTDASGAYELPIGPDSGRFVFATTPRGYWTDKFYVPIESAAKAGRADFALRPVEQPGRFDFVFITDMHLENRAWGVAKTVASLKEILALKPAPAFLWAQGDICLEGGVGNEYVECLAHAGVPVRNGAGNHEMLLGRKNPRDEFERRFGPTYYSFDWGPMHCVVLDGNKPIAGETGWKAVHGAVEGSELAWLRADLAAQPEERPIVVGVHIPIVSTYPERRRHSPKDAPYWEMTNNDVLTDLFARRRVRLVLQGHMHENERATVGGVEYAASISLSGNWWKAKESVERGVDGTPRGYRIVSVDGTKVTHRYRPSCESFVDRQGEFVGLSAPVPARSKAEFVFNCYDAPNGSTAQARIDQGQWRPMPAFPAVNKALDLVMPHHFRLVADLAGFSPGPHAVEARVSWPDGREVREKGAFQVAGR